MPQRIIYHSESETEVYDLDRFVASLNKYGAVDKDTVAKAVEDFGAFDPLHASCLVEIGVKILPEEAAKKYFDDHKHWFETEPDFERLRRITGYLVGTLSRWNDAKKAEEAARVKHGLNGQYTQEEKAEIETAKLENSVMSQF